MPARWPRVGRRARADPTADLAPWARPGFLRPRPGPAHLAAPAPAPGLPRRRAPPPPVPRAHRPAPGSAAPGRRRAHQCPDRPPPGHIGGNGGYSPGKHLPPAAGLQPDRRRHPRLRRPDALTPPHPRPGPPRLAARNPAVRVPCGRPEGLARPGVLADPRLRPSAADLPRSATV